MREIMQLLPESTEHQKKIKNKDADYFILYCEFFLHLDLEIEIFHSSLSTVATSCALDGDKLFQLFPTQHLVVVVIF